MSALQFRWAQVHEKMAVQGGLQKTQAFLFRAGLSPTKPSAGPTARVPHPTSLDKLSAWMRGGDKGLGFRCTHSMGPSQPCTLWSSTWVSLMNVSVPTRLPIQEDLRSSATRPTLSLPDPTMQEACTVVAKLESSLQWAEGFTELP